MLRKVFERLLLSRFDHDGWAKIHPTQAGFRSHYSTYTNAAMVYHALSTGLRGIAVFLDFKLNSTSWIILYSKVCLSSVIIFPICSP
jgi:hypothetical protein